jgi:hypothetical protein
MSKKMSLSKSVESVGLNVAGLLDREYYQKCNFKNFEEVILNKKVYSLWDIFFLDEKKYLLLAVQGTDPISCMAAHFFEVDDCNDDFNDIELGKDWFPVTDPDLAEVLAYELRDYYESER